MKRQSLSAGQFLSISSQSLSKIAYRLKVISSRRVDLYVKFHPDQRVTAATLASLKEKLSTELQLQTESKLSDKTHIYRLRFAKSAIEKVAYASGMTFSEQLDEILIHLKSKAEVCNVAKSLAGLLTAKELHQSGNLFLGSKPRVSPIMIADKFSFQIKNYLQSLYGVKRVTTKPSKKLASNDAKPAMLSYATPSRGFFSWLK